MLTLALAALASIGHMLSPAWLAAAAALAVIGYLLVAKDVVGESVVATFWILFAVYQTVMAEAGLEIPGIFYPIYALLIVNLIANLTRNRVRFDTWSGWVYGAFMVLVLASLVGMVRAVDFFVLQRLASYVFGLLVAFQVGSRRGIGPILAGAVISGVTVAIWVIVKAAEGGFDYRADIEVDQNFTAFIIGLGLVVALTIVIWRLLFRVRGSVWVTVTCWLAMATMFYATLLLASRGMIIALGITAIALLVRYATLSRKALWIFALIVAIVSASFLLPGATGLLERFRGDSVETGGGRIPVWERTFEAYAASNPWNLALGNGFKSSEQVVERRFAFTSVHNAYLQILYEFGLVGLALFGLIHFRLGLVAWRLRSELGVIGFGLILFLLGANLTADTPDGFMYWTALGLVAAIGAYGRDGPGAGARQHAG